MTGILGLKFPRKSISLKIYFWRIWNIAEVLSIFLLADLTFCRAELLNDFIFAFLVLFFLGCRSAWFAIGTVTGETNSVGLVREKIYELESFECRWTSGLC